MFGEDPVQSDLFTTVGGPETDFTSWWADLFQYGLPVSGGKVPYILSGFAEMLASEVRLGGESRSGKGMAFASGTRFGRQYDVSSGCFLSPLSTDNGRRKVALMINRQAFGELAGSCRLGAGQSHRIK